MNLFDKVNPVFNIDEEINELIESNQMLKSHGIMFNELMTKRKTLKK